MDVLLVRFILNLILMLGLLVVVISLWIQKLNGITKAMSMFTFFAMLHVGMLMLLGLVDVTQNMEVLRLERIVWNWISLGWILAGIWLVYKLLRSKYE